MKRIIDGKRYDSEAPQTSRIASCESGLPESDFGWSEVGLYRTGRGSYFLAGEGGPMTEWASHNGNTSTYGTGIKPLSELEAMQWCERNDAYETIEKYFSHMIEDA